MYEEALPSASIVNDRKKFLEFFAVWALLKKEVSAGFVIPLLEGWFKKIDLNLEAEALPRKREDEVLEYIAQYSKWFNSPTGGTYVLYHERLRAFVLQKISGAQFKACHEAIIHQCRVALQVKAGDEWERYALEHLSTHLLTQAMESKDATALKALAYETAHWNRQVEISKGFEWSKRMLNDMMLWASKYDDDEVIECALNKVDLHHLEQNDAPRIVELVAQNDIETALQRIESFGGNDQEGLQRKFILYMLCLMELTLLDSKDKPFRKEAIEKLLMHLDDNLPVDHSVLNWNDFFPSYLMFLMACKMAELELDYLMLYERTIDWDFNWESEPCPINNLSLCVLNDCVQSIREDETRILSLMTIYAKCIEQSKYTEALSIKQRAMVFVNSFSELTSKCRALTLLAKHFRNQGDMEGARLLLQEALEITENLDEQSDRSKALCGISIELLNLGNLVLAIKCSASITEESDRLRLLNSISIEFARQGNFGDAFKVAPRNGIDNRIDSKTLSQLALELAKQGRIEDSFRAIEEIAKKQYVKIALEEVSIELAKQTRIDEALNCARKIGDEMYMSYALKGISIELVNQSRYLLAAECAAEIHNRSQKSIAFGFISVSLAKCGLFEESLSNAENIIDAYHKGLAFKDIAIIYFRNGLHDVYRHLLERSFSCLFSLSYDDYDKGGILLGVARELASIGDVQSSIRVLDGLRYASEKFDVMKHVSNEICISGKFQELCNVYLHFLASNSRVDPNWCDKSLNDLSLRLAQMSFFERSIMTAQAISEEWDSALALWKIAIEAVNRHEYELSIEIVQKINEPNHRDLAFHELAICLLRMNEFDLVLHVSDLLYEINEGIYSPMQSDLAFHLFEMDQHDRAQIIIHKWLNCAYNSAEPIQKCEMLAEISSALYRQGKFEECDGIILDAIECSEEITDEDDLDFALSLIVRELSRQLKFEQAEYFMSKISDRSEKDTSLECLSKYLIEQNRINEATNRIVEIKSAHRSGSVWIGIVTHLIGQSEFDRAMSISEIIQNEEAKSKAYKVISIGFAKAMRVNECLDVVDQINSDSIKCEALMEVASEFLLRMNIDEAMLCVNANTDDYSKSKVLSRISLELATMGHLLKALTVSLDIADSSLRHECFNLASLKSIEIIGWKNTMIVVGSFPNHEARRFCSRACVESLKQSEFDTEILSISSRLFKDDLSSLEIFYQKFALNCLFIRKSKDEQLTRLNRTLNIQWAIDIKNSFSAN